MSAFLIVSGLVVLAVALVVRKYENKYGAL